MLKTIIIEDDEFNRSRLTRMLKNYFYDSVELSGTFANHADGFDAINAGGVDLVFFSLDSCLQKIVDTNFQWEWCQNIKNIIVTAPNKQLEQKALCLSGMPHLVKPFFLSDLVVKINDIPKKHKEYDYKKRLEILSHNLIHEPDEKRRLCLQTPAGLLIVSITDVLHIHQTPGNALIRISKNRLPYTEVQLPADSYDLTRWTDLFCKVQDGLYINVHAVDSYHMSDLVTLKDGTTIPVFDKYRANLLRLIADIWLR